jgi:hypothetical protein
MRGRRNVPRKIGTTGATALPRRVGQAYIRLVRVGVAGRVSHAKGTPQRHFVFYFSGVGSMTTPAVVPGGVVGGFLCFILFFCLGDVVVVALAVVVVVVLVVVAAAVVVVVVFMALGSCSPFACVHLRYLFCPTNQLSNPPFII